jgi:hypothetical protein
MQAVAQGLLVVCCACLAPRSLALGVGEPVLLSAYSQPLRVRLPLSLDSAEEVAAAGDIQAELLPETQYGKYGIAEQRLDPTGLRAVYQGSAAGGQIEISSEAPVHELATILLLRVRLAGTQMVKEVPLLFDLEAAAAPAAATVAVGAGHDSTAPVAAPATVAAEQPAASHHHHRQQAAASSTLFQFSTTLKYSSATAGLRLSENFDSYAEHLQSDSQRGAAAQPAAVESAAVQTPAASAPTRPPAPVPQHAQPRGFGAWLPYGLAALAGWILLRRRRRETPAAPAMTAPRPAPDAPSIPAAAHEAAEDPAAPIRSRLNRLSRGKLDPDQARRALLVDAFLDLKRHDSATRLLEELERDYAASPAMRGDRADIAAAVKR